MLKDHVTHRERLDFRTPLERTVTRLSWAFVVGLYVGGIAYEIITRI